MELEFDKEIDALMRKGGLAVGGSPAGGHLDADEIAAFAENAMPERAKSLYLGHIADCDRCRSILSNLIALNAEAEPEMAAAAVPVSVPLAAETPWYRKLFLFPNLAYVMGGLVLVMGGLIGLSVFQGSLGGGSATVSQMDESESVRGPMAPTEPVFSANANRSANAANILDSSATTANSNAAMASSPAGSANAGSTSAANTATQNKGTDSTSARAPSSADVAMTDTTKPMQPTAAPPPPAMMEVAPKDAERAKEDDAKARTVAQENEKKKISARSADKREELSIDGRQAQNVPRTQAGGVAKPAPGPTRDMQQNFPNRADNTYELKSRRVGGKDFQFRNGAWYDTAYKGQPTINVRRGTDEYQKLDSGMRSVAERLSGVVVVVSGAKAYRIQ